MKEEKCQNLLESQEWQGPQNKTKLKELYS
jgi:hypothetical protein